MERVTIDKKKYVIVEEQKFEQLQQIAAAKTPSQKKLSLTEGKAHAYQLIEAWVESKHPTRGGYFCCRNFLFY